MFCNEDHWICRIVQRDSQPHSNYKFYNLIFLLYERGFLTAVTEGCEPCQYFSIPFTLSQRDV